MRGRSLSVLLLCAISTVAMTAASVPAMAEEANHGSPVGRFDRPRDGFMPPWTRLRDGTPEQVNLAREPIAAAEAQIAAWTDSHPDPTLDHPLYSGAVSLVAHNGVVVSRSEAGMALRYSDGSGTELPADEQVPMRQDTIFDMASVSKLFTAVALMQLVESGQVDLNEPVGTYLPEFGVNGKETITVEQLLTHTSGLIAWIPLWRDYPDIPSRIQAVMEIEPKYEPGSTYEYSDLNLITLGVLIERLTGSSLDTVVRERITEPLRMTDTGYNPPAGKLDRIAATEYQVTPPRGMVRGEVHDENAWSLGGVAGHAGIFSTASDMAVFAQMILNGGSYGGERILRRDTVELMLTNHNTEFPGDDRGLGFELNQRWYMGGLTATGTAGHTGYTGTSLVIDPMSRSFAILLTNRVHPSRDWGSINLAREGLANGVAKALAVRPRRGPDAWYTGIGDASEATLATPALVAGGDVQVRFNAFVDTEAGFDSLVLESSLDGETWQPVPVQASGRGAPEGVAPELSGAGHRGWWTVETTVPVAEPGTNITLRWRFSTDRRYTGRGVLLDRILITDGNRTLLNGEKEPHKFQPHGWKLESR